MKHLIHAVRHSLSPAYRERHELEALAQLRAEAEAQYHQRQLDWANDHAATLRSLGMDVPVGTVFAGVMVTK